MSSKTHRPCTKPWLFVEISRAEFLFASAIRQVWATKFSVKPGDVQVQIVALVVAVVTQFDKIKITKANTCKK